jgi:hypothetical protein
VWNAHLLIASRDTAAEQELVVARQAELELVVGAGRESQVRREYLTTQTHERSKLRRAHAVQAADPLCLEIRHREPAAWAEAGAVAQGTELSERLPQDALDEGCLVRQAPERIREVRGQPVGRAGACSPSRYAPPAPAALPTWKARRRAAV